MKLRLNGNNVALRLSADEIQELSKAGRIVSVTEFTNVSFHIILRIVEEDEIDIEYSSEGFIFSFPRKEIDPWIESSKVGFSRVRGQISLTIEKDLKKRHQ